MQDNNMLIETYIHQEDIREKMWDLQKNYFTLRTRTIIKNFSKLLATLTLITIVQNILMVKDKHHTG